MARYRVTIASPKSAEDVFAYMAMFSNVTEWDPTGPRLTGSTATSPGQGARFHVLVRWLGRAIPLDCTTTAYEPPKRVVFRAENSTTISEDTITVKPTGAGCEMTYEAHLTLKGVMRFIYPLLGLAVKRLGNSAATGLRRELGTG